MDDCEDLEFTPANMFNGMVSAAQGIPMNMEVAEERLCHYRDKFFGHGSPEDEKKLKMRLCNMDALDCPRESDFAQNMGCNIRPMFGIAEVFAGSAETPQMRFNFGERGIKISMSFSIISGGLEKMVDKMKVALTAAQAATAAGSSGNAAGAETHSTSQENMNQAGIASQAIGGLVSVCDLLTGFEVAVTVMKGRGGDLNNGVATWNFDIDMVSLNDIPGFSQLFAFGGGNANQYGWTKVIYFSGGKLYMMGHEVAEMPMGSSTNSHDQTVLSSLSATKSLMQTLMKYFGAHDNDSANDDGEGKQGKQEKDPCNTGLCKKGGECGPSPKKRSSDKVRDQKLKAAEDARTQKDKEVKEAVDMAENRKFDDAEKAEAEGKKKAEQLNAENRVAVIKKEKDAAEQKDKEVKEAIDMAENRKFDDAEKEMSRLATERTEREEKAYAAKKEQYEAADSTFNPHS